MDQFQTKLAEMQKKRDRIEKEWIKAKNKLHAQEELVEKKEHALKLLDAELVSFLLVTNDLSMKDLPQLVQQTKKEGIPSIPMPKAMEEREDNR